MKKLPKLLFAFFISTSSFAQTPGAAINCDGINDYCDPNTLVSTINNNFTFEMWARPTATHEIDAESLFSIGGISGQRFLIWPTWRGNNAGIGISVGTNGVSVYEHGSNYLTSILTWTGNVTNWTHIAVSVINKISNLYINGQLVRVGLSTNRPVIYPSLGECGQYPGLLGGIGGGSYGWYKGDVDEVRYWTVVRTQAEIQANMNNEINCPANLLAYYKFNHGFAAMVNTVTTLIDYSGNNYNALLTNYASNGTISNWIAPGGVVSGSGSSISVTPSNTTICPGQSVTFVASGAATYTITNGITSSTLLTVQPSASTNYTISSYNGPNCTLTTTCSVIVSGTVASINVTPASATVCPGQTVTFAATGGGSVYTISNGTSTSNILTVQPSTSTAYTISSQYGGNCVTTATCNVVVSDTIASLIVTPSSATICPGQTVSFTATGGGSVYMITNGLTSSNVLTVQPSTNTSYTISSPSGPNCITTATCNVIISGTTTGINVTPTNTTICIGQKVTFLATGGSTYSVYNGTTSSNVMTVQPNATTSYTISSPNGPNCTVSAVCKIQVGKCVGIANELQNKNWSVHPNPFSAELIFAGLSNAQIEIYDVSGRLLKKRSLENQNEIINLSELNSGLYIVVIISADERSTIKILKE